MLPSPPPLVDEPYHWLKGPLHYLQHDPLKWVPRWVEQYGDLFTIRSRIGSGTVVANPEWAREVLTTRYPRYQEKSRAYGVLRTLMGNGLVTSSGEFWRGQRKLTQPAFHRRRLQAIFAMMVAEARACAAELAATRAGEVVDCSAVLSQLTLDIITRAMFSTEVEDRAAEVGRHLATLNEAALKMLRQPWRFFLPRSFPTPFSAREFHAHAGLDGAVRGIIARRRERPDEHDDLLAMFLSACDEETGRGMSDGQLRDEVMTMFVAGHETTANAMSWLLHLVSRHPEVEVRLVAEIATGEAVGALDAGDLAAFPYARQVVEESLRLYPTIWSVGRRCAEEDEIGGYRIRPGTQMLIPIFHFHWSDRYWDRPQRFDPDRFLPERRPAADSAVYMPFAAGPRGCIGQQFALQELVIMTVVFFGRLAFRPVEGPPVEAEALITLRPRGGMKLRVEERGERVAAGAAAN